MPPQCYGCECTIHSDNGVGLCPRCRRTWWDSLRKCWRQWRIRYAICAHPYCDNLMVLRDKGSKEQKYCGARCRRSAWKISSRQRYEEGAQKPYRRPRRARDKALAIAYAHGYKCHECKRLIDVSLPSTHDRALQIDHLVPLSKGGDDSPANLAPTHAICNQRRSNRANAQLQVFGG